MVSATFVHRFGYNEETQKIPYEQQVAYSADKVRGMCLAQLRKKVKERDGNALYSLTFDVEADHSYKVCVAYGTAVRLKQKPTSYQYEQKDDKSIHFYP